MQVKGALCLLAVTFFFLCLAHSVSGLQKDDGFEDYGPEPLAADDPKGANPKDPKAAGDAAGAAAAGGADPNKPSEEPEEEDKTKTRFSDDRFAKLFPNRGGATRNGFQARNVVKPKPTLPSFIKSTQPYVKAQVSTTPAPRARARAITPQNARGGARGGVTSTTTTPRPVRGRNAVTPRGGLNNNSQLSGRLSTARTTAAPFNSQPSTASPSAAAIAAARRRQSGISRFSRLNNNNSNNSAANNSNNNQQLANNNSTIPALPNVRRN